MTEATKQAEEDMTCGGSRPCGEDDVPRLCEPVVPDEFSRVDSGCGDPLPPARGDAPVCGDVALRMSAGVEEVRSGDSESVPCRKADPVAGTPGFFRRTSRKFARVLTRMVDWFYIAPFRAFMPIQTFRYAACGGGNLVLNWVLYFVLYNFILDKRFFDLGVIVISPYIAAFLISFPITFLTGFWLQKYIAFKSSPLGTRVQLFRYLISVLGSVVLNYAGLKLFVEVLHVWPTFSQVMASLVTIAYSYAMQKYFTFRGCTES